MCSKSERGGRDVWILWAKTLFGKLFNFFSTNISPPLPYTYPPATHSDTQIHNALYIEAGTKWRCTCPTSHPGPRPIRFPTRCNPRNQNTCNKQHNMKWKKQMFRDELAKYETFGSYLILNKLIPKRAFDHFWTGCNLSCGSIIIKTSKYLWSLLPVCIITFHWYCTGNYWLPLREAINYKTSLQNLEMH